MSRYEKQWQEALTGANIQPSAALWENIEANLNSGRGNRAWLTILLIAATITIAFAFPLTIGNSSFEMRPQDYQIAGKVENETIESLKETSTAEQSVEVESKAQVANAHGHRNGVAMRTPINSPKVTLRSEQFVGIQEAEIGRIDMTDMEMAGYSTGDIIDDYYLIPFYIPSTQSINRNMLASINLGTGSSSAGSGFNGLGAFANADMAVSELSDQDPDTRTENSGNTYYFGAGVELPMGKRWSFLAGLGYLAQTASGSSNLVYDNGNGYQPMGTYDPIIPGTVFLSDTYEYSVRNTYINVPLTVKYPFINRHIKFRVGMGVSTDFMVGHTVNSNSYGKANYKPASMNYSPVVLAGLLNLDLSYSVSNQYSVAFETGLRKGFTSIDKDKEYYPSSFTVGLVLFYKIQ